MAGRFWKVESAFSLLENVSCFLLNHNPQVPGADISDYLIPSPLGCYLFITHLTTSGTAMLSPPYIPLQGILSDILSRLPQTRIPGKFQPFSNYPFVKYLFIILRLVHRSNNINCSTEHSFRSFLDFLARRSFPTGLFKNRVTGVLDERRNFFLLGEKDVKSKPCEKGARCSTPVKSIIKNPCSLNATQIESFMSLNKQCNR